MYNNISTQIRIIRWLIPKTSTWRLPPPSPNTPTHTAKTDTINTIYNRLATAVQSLAPYLVHPCEKVIGMFLQNQIWSRLLDINRLRFACIKKATEEVKKCQISKRGYQQGLSDETLKKALCQFCHVKFDHRIMEAVGFFDDEMRIFAQNTFNFRERWGKSVASWFSYIIRIKWYFRKLYTIK